MADQIVKQGIKSKVFSSESGVIKTGQGKLKAIHVASTSSGTVKVVDGVEAGTAASGKITSSGACAPAVHATSKITSSGAMVAGTHAVNVLTGSDNFKIAVAASAVLTSDQTDATDGKKVTIGTTVYRFKTVPVAPYDVKRGTSAAATMSALVDCVNGAEWSGQYFQNTPPHPDVTAVLTSTYVMTVTAKVAGTDGNAIAKAEDDDHLDWDGTGDVLTGGLANETVTIGTTVYKFVTTPKDNYDVKLGATLTASLLNLKYAINATASYAGSSYGINTPAHTQVVATASNATTLTIRGRVPGTSLNAVATTETGASCSWADTTLGGGTGASDAGVTVAAATITIGDVVYTIVDELTETYGAAARAYQVKKGANEAAMLDNLKLAINGTASGLGTLFSTGTAAHPYVIATTNSNTVQVIVARAVGGDDFTAAVNALPTTTTAANTAWEDTTLGGGTGDSNPAVTTAAATITIGGRTYTVVTELSETSGATASADEILWVTNEATFLDNLKLAINGTGTMGTQYSTGTYAHEYVDATTNSNTEQTVVYKLLGTIGNALATSTTLANYAFGATTLASGAGQTAKVILDTTTPAANSHIDFHNLEFEYGLYIVVTNTIVATVIYE